MRSPPPIAYDHAGRLETDLPCVGCGHNLRGLLPAGRCAECGSPVNWSLSGSLLDAADPDWLRRVASGVAVLAILSVWVWSPVVWPIYALGLWRLSAPEPRESAPGSLAVGLRIAATWALALIVGLSLLPFSSLLAGLLPWLPGWLLGGELLYVALLAYSLTQVLLARRLRHLARRGGSPRLVALTGIVWMLNLIAVPSCAVLLVIQVFANTSPTPVDSAVMVARLGTAALVPACPLSIVALALTWRLLRLAEIMARALREEIRVWQGPTPGAARPQPAAATPTDDAGSAPAEPV